MTVAQNTIDQELFLITNMDCFHPFNIFSLNPINIIKIILFAMFNKFAQSQSTIVSSMRELRALSSQKEGQSALKNPFRQKLPLKFPKNAIVKPCGQNMLTQTTQNPESSSLRIYAQHNRSRFFQYCPLPLSQTQVISRHPQHLFDTYHQRKLSNPGQYGHLSRQSSQTPIRMRTYEDIGVTNNEKRIFSKMHYKPDPIVTGQSQSRFNSSLQNVWKEPRRHRDNGLECQKVLQNTTHLKKRQPYGAHKKSNNSNSYTEMYLKNKTYRQK